MPHRTQEFPWLVPMGLTAWEIRGDGNCLFSAFSDQLYGNQGRNTEIRKTIVKYLRENRDTFLPFFAVEPRRNPPRKATRASSSRSSPSKSSFSRSFSAASPEETERLWEHYLKNMEQSGTWGDHTEIQAFMRAYNYDVKVFESAKTIYHLRPQDDDVVRPIVYITHHNWHHFSSVRKLDGSFIGLPEAPPKDLLAIPSIELTEPDSQISSQLPPPSRLPPLLGLSAKSDLPQLFAFSDDDNSTDDNKFDEDNDSASSYSASSRAGSVGFGTTPTPRIIIKLRLRQNRPQKNLNSRERKKAVHNEARKKSKRHNLSQSNLATSTTPINQIFNRDSPAMEEVMGMMTLKP